MYSCLLSVKYFAVDRTLTHEYLCAIVLMVEGHEEKIYLLATKFMKFQFTIQFVNIIKCKQAST